MMNPKAIKKIIASFFNEDYMINGDRVNQVIDHRQKLDESHVLAIISIIMSGLQDLNNEVYRSTHDTIPADTKSYRSISSKINRSYLNYDRLYKTVVQYAPVNLNMKAVVPFGYCDSACGTYRRYGKKELRNSISTIKKHAPVLQLSLFN